MATIEELQSRRDALAAAIASGSEEVRDQFGRYIRYRSLSDMRSTLAAIDAEIEVAAGMPQSTINRRFRLTTSTTRGL